MSEVPPRYKLLKNSEDWKNGSEALRNLAVAFGVIVGGIWALVKYTELLEVEVAQAELQYKQAAIQITLAEAEVAKEIQSLEVRRRRAELQKQAVLEIAIQTGQVRSDGDRYRLVGTVTLKNIGDTAAMILFPLETPAIEIVRLVPVDNVLRRYDRRRYSIEDHVGPIQRAEVHVGRVLSLPFVLWLERPGLYMIAFSADVMPGTENQEEGDNPENITQVAWQELRLIEVTEER